MFEFLKKLFGFRKLKIEVEPGTECNHTPQVEESKVVVVQVPVAANEPEAEPAQQPAPQKRKRPYRKRSQKPAATTEAGAPKKPANKPKPKKPV